MQAVIHCSVTKFSENPESDNGFLRNGTTTICAEPTFILFTPVKKTL